jgi:hypothetical protein
MEQNEIGWACSSYGGEERCIKDLVVKSEEKGTRHKWDNIKMDLQEVCWGSMEWIDMAQDKERWWALVNAVTKMGRIS